MRRESAEDDRVFMLMSPARKVPAIWTMAFRPFFLAAALWSALALALWIAMLAFGFALPSRFDPLTWHIHEMLFGFVPAAIAGFLLTAISNWTGRAPVYGAVLAGLAGLWLAGRIDCLISAFIPFWLAAAIDVAFPIAVCMVAARELVAARNWRNLSMPAPIAVIAIADLLVFLQQDGFAVPEGLGWRLGFATIVILISVVGTRIIPTFTRNWLAAHATERLLPDHGGNPGHASSHRLLDRTALGLLHASLIGWAFAPTFRPFGALLILAAVLNFARLLYWRGAATCAEPLLFSLHVGYFWLVVGAALLGATMLTPAFPLAAAIHAFTAGAMGAMILAVMTRVSLGHTGRPIEADWPTTLLYILVNAAAVARIAAAFPGADTRVVLLDISAALWVASLAAFALRYGPLLVAPRTR
jgi:uncharacterized protein involved in response to NO